MFRLRRYRVFLAFAVITIIALYQFSSSSSPWTEQAASRFGQSQGGDTEPQVKWEPKPQVAKETKQFEVEVSAATNPQAKQTPPPIAPVEKPVDKKSTTAQGKNSIPVGVGAGHAARPDATSTPATEEKDRGQDILGALLSSSEEAAHWTKMKEQYPVPTESLIALPTAKAKSIPKIQADFKKESDVEKADREIKLGTIKDVFKRSWSGYKEFAWLHDEVMPVSGSKKDPFAGWGATLVDALDTLWIMGLKEEFEEAVKAVEKIDFTTTHRSDIPLFETTIRYLGGFLAAYDMAGKQHEILLTKAKELAEILMAAFDTPNRMPQTYYFWQPDFSAIPHPASNHVVLAEIGSLSMEFTYLAQLTGDHKYYDAIARITDNLEGYQNHTRLPGMWPTYFDASGCVKHQYNTSPNKPLQKPITAGDPGWDEALKNGAYLKANPSQPLVLPPAKDGSIAVGVEELSPNGKKYIPLEKPEPLKMAPNGPNPTWKPPPEESIDWPGPPNAAPKKRQLAAAGFSSVPEATPVKSMLAAVGFPSDPEATPVKPTCDNPGFGPSSTGGREEYTLGGMSDSTYEYLPKQYLLLGGQVEKYRTMYEVSAEVMKKYLIFRPMLPNNDDILFSGKLLVYAQEPGEPLTTDLEPEYAHLTCFTGGMFGMSARIFERPKDLEIAAKLTEGCVYAYNMTATGIMPEAFEGVACESQKVCTWNETLYNEVLDPNADIRLKQHEEAMANYEIKLKSASLWFDEQMKAYMEATAAPVPVATSVVAPVAEVTKVPDSVLDKRELADLAANRKGKVLRPPQNGSTNAESGPADDEPPTKIATEEEEEPSPSRVMPTFPAIYSPQVPLNHEEYVKMRLEEERLPLGVTRIKAREYILRPEAIESVWYMYRLTGDSYWREAGWRMFEAIETHTKTLHGNSAIDDVTKTSPTLNDSMESFWLAETLKYYYLLFSEEDVVSLDEWVLNTEAHPFRRPKA
ncbi:seven-hairpin glycosidase [Bimuria novae-zelandiae CBS 107.79]|uniref:alpha-1,2-Mannosidase n=1 Tax=Bimuria novae-zelandiae CBS 107.79 TaxID=1447943 RepID=A0A6A5VKF6_9PLEO|nr:seven-hairpin glycosidase [Bimuria novae-zelandiae CBS 107.79]